MPPRLRSSARAAAAHAAGSSGLSLLDLPDELLINIIARLADVPFPAAALPGYAGTDPRPDGGAWNADGCVTALMLTCKRLRAVATLPALWVCVQLTGPVRILSAPECAALAARRPQQAVLGARASPFACAALLAAAGPSLRSISFELPPTARWAHAMADIMDILAARCPRVTSLHVAPHYAGAADADALADEPPQHGEWPAPSGRALLALLRQRRLRSVSLMEVGVPCAALRELGAAAGDSLRTLRLFPDSRAQLAAAVEGAPGLSALRLLCTSWHTAPQLLPAFLRAAGPALRRLDVHWLRDFALPPGMPPDELAALLVQGADAVTNAAIAHGPHMHHIFHDGDPAAAGAAAPGEVEACLRAVAEVAAATEAGDAHGDGDGEGTPRTPRTPLTLTAPDVDALSAAAVAAALRTFPRLELAVTPADDAEDDDWWDSER